MSSPCGQRAPQADPPSFVAEYRLGPKRNCGVAGLFQAWDGAEAPLGDVYLLKLQRAWLREPGSHESLRRELSQLSSLRAEHLVLARELVRLDEQEYVVLHARRAVTFDKLIGKVRRGGVRLPAAVISRIFLDVAAGLEALHAQLERRRDASGRSHAALSGTTIWIGDDGAALVLDCGLARALPAQARRAQSGLFGELGCKPPEALAGSALGASSDTYSMTVLLCEALSGRRLFLRESLEETLSAISDSRSPHEGWPSQLGLAPEFVAKGLAMNPSERYPTAREFASALRRQIPPASREDTEKWVRYWVWERRSSWPAADVSAERASGGGGDDEEVTYRDFDQPTQVMSQEQPMEPPLSGRGVSSEMAASLMRSVPPQLLRRLTEQEALERRGLGHAAPPAAVREPAVWRRVHPDPVRAPRWAKASRLGPILLGVAVGVLACVAWESYRAAWSSGAPLSLPSPPVAAAPGSRASEPEPSGVRAPATATVPAPVAEGGGSGGRARSNPGAGLHASGLTRASRGVELAPREASGGPGDPHDSAPSPARDGVDEPAPAAIQIPTRLHPRLNPLMTAQQVYAETR